MRKFCLAIAILSGLSGAVYAQSPGAGQGQGTGVAVSGVSINRGTVNGSATITTGNTFQTVINSLTTTAVQRFALTIENNNASDSCWVFVGSGAATKATSMLLTSGGSYTRYWPYVPSDAVQATCASTSDSLYIEVQ